MVLIGLLLIALVCLALGLVLPSSAWLVASLIASAGAGYLLVRARHAIGVTRPARAAHAGHSAAQTATPAQPSASTAPEPTPLSSAAADDEVWVIDGRPRYHLADCAIIQGQQAEPIPFEQATEDGFMACSLCEPNVVHSSSPS
ncbi:MAG: hypothetical protein QOH14_3491 [Pseudonocardiales bacterium]|jgi:hypothetical protein|nr:hypothetical protein [Pseudonocardiales bacterium]